MNQKIQEILNDVYDIDPTLKGKEEELKKALKKMLEIKPDIQINEQFKNDLRQRLYVEAKYGTRNKFNIKNLIQILTSFAVGGAVVAFSFMIMPDTGTKDDYNMGMTQSARNLEFDDSFLRENKKIDENPMDRTDGMDGMDNIEDIDDDVMTTLNTLMDNNDTGGMGESSRVSTNTIDSDGLDLSSITSEDDYDSIDEIEFENDNDNEKSFDDEIMSDDNIDNSAPILESFGIEPSDDKHFYKYSFSGELPEIDDEYKYYKITSLNMGSIDIEEIMASVIDINNIELLLDTDRILSSVIPPDDEGYEEIVYDKVEFTYMREYKMKSEYLVPALWFSTSRVLQKGETFKRDQFIPLVNIKE